MPWKLPLREFCSVLLGPERPRTYEDLSDTIRNDTMQMSVPPILCFKDFPKFLQLSILHRSKAIGTTSNASSWVLILPKEDRESQLFDDFELIQMLPNQATIQDGRVVVENVQGRQNQNQRYLAWGNGTAGNSVGPWYRI
ncbi:hypothetical protein Tco_0641769 [Tanacetum coccineum]